MKKLWQFLKRWRQAYLDDKGDRLHAEAERNALCCGNAIDVESIQQQFSCLNDGGNIYEQAYRDSIRIFPSNREETEQW